MEEAISTESKLERYLEETFRPEDRIMKEVREFATKQGLPAIHIGRFTGQFLEVLTRITNANKVVELGTLGGYSGICIARGLGEGGKLYTFELNPKHAQVAREAFKRAGVQDRVEMFIGPALDNLSKIQDQGPFDLVFIDADKSGYPKYLAWATENLRIGGIVLADDTLAHGMLVDDRFENQKDETTVKAIRTLNRQVTQSDRYRATFLSIEDGLTLATKLK